jgi:HPt (histidine-containing phosphotransfer) domain-containing protein
VGAFSDSARALPAQLADADADQAAMALHSFKGLAGTLGALRLAALGEAGEALLKGGAGLDARWLGALDEQIQSACRAMLRMADSLSDLSPAPAGRPLPTDAQAFEAGLRQLMQLLRDFDMGAIDAFAQLREHHAAQGPLEDVEVALAGLDFERALTLCQALLDEEMP